MDDPTWTIAANWQRQRELIEDLYRRRDITVGMTLPELLAWHMDPGPGYGYVPSGPVRERSSRPLPPPSQEERQREEERYQKAHAAYEAARDRLARRFGLLDGERVAAAAAGRVWR